MKEREQGYVDSGRRVQNLLHCCRDHVGIAPLDAVASGSAVASICLAVDVDVRTRGSRNSGVVTGFVFTAGGDMPGSSGASDIDGESETFLGHFGIVLPPCVASISVLTPSCL